MNTDKKDMILDLESTEITNLGRLSDAIENRRQALLQILAKLPDDD